ncbi:MAG: response regulator transcription factor [Chloroflexota bacterium]
MSNRRKIMVIDDEKKIVQLVKAYLERDGYKVLAAYDGQEALNLAQREKPDLVVLDLMLPGLSGLDVCRTLRQESDVPIIMLTARAEETDKLVGLELGADDYVTKPFSPRELVARVRAVLRRTEPTPTVERVARGDITVDLVRHEAWVRGSLVPLTPTEFELLATLIQSPGRVFTRLQLLDKVLGLEYEGYERTIDAHVKNLRQKIEADSRNPRYVVTVYGVGYKFQETKP